MKKPTVGDVSTETAIITESLIKKYADITGDENPLHLDESYAEQTIFEEQIAHGMLVMGFVSSALADYDGVIVYVSQDIEFINPIVFDTNIIAKCEIVESLEKNQYRVQTTVIDADNSTEYISGEAIIMIRDEPATDS